MNTRFFAIILKRNFKEKHKKWVPVHIKSGLTVGKTLSTQATEDLLLSQVKQAEPDRFAGL